VLAREEKPTPEGWVIDENGQYATDTEQLLEGFLENKNALLPLGGLGELMGGHKGYGLGVMVEIFSTAFQKNAFMHNLPGGGACRLRSDISSWRLISNILSL
jgi:LDH2 family malate/lactate/ureidoglycolate dehydrogenase